MSVVIETLPEDDREERLGNLSSPTGEMSDEEFDKISETWRRTYQKQFQGKVLSATPPVVIERYYTQHGFDGAVMLCWMSGETAGALMVPDLGALDVLIEGLRLTKEKVLREFSAQGQ